MIPPHPTDDIRDFIRFCSHIPGPGDVSKRKGATPRQIEELWDLGGKEFPPFYWAFLEEFGASDGGLGLFGDADGSIEELIEDYRLLPQLSFRLRPPNALMISGPDLIGRLALLYADGPSDPEPNVVRIDGEYVEKLARSFCNFMYSQVFNQIFFPSGTSSDAQLVSSKPSLLPEVQRLLTILGLESCWFSDDLQFSMHSAGRTVVALPGFGDSTDIWVKCMEPAEGDHIKEALLECFELKDCSSKRPPP